MVQYQGFNIKGSISSNIREREKKGHEREEVVLLLKEYGISVPRSNCTSKQVTSQKEDGSLPLH